MEEYGIKIHYIQGCKNTVADILSRYPTHNNPESEENSPNPGETAEYLAVENDLPVDAFPLSFKILSNFQQRDPATDSLLLKDPDKKHVSRQTFHGGEQLVCYDGKIFVPPPLRKKK